MNYSLKISQDRNGAIPKTEKILCWQPSVSDESRENGLPGCEHNPGHRRPDGCGRENPKKQDDDAERTLMQGGQHPAVLTPVRLPLGRLRRQREGARQNRCRPQTNTIPPSETDTGIPRSSPVSGDGDHVPYERNAVISRHFERDPIPYALETDWPVGAGPATFSIR